VLFIIVIYWIFHDTVIKLFSVYVFILFVILKWLKVITSKFASYKIESLDFGYRNQHHIENNFEAIKSWIEGPEASDRKRLSKSQADDLQKEY
jgi:hypothetical protein